jgi:hypothetical protein
MIFIFCHRRFDHIRKVEKTASHCDVTMATQLHSDDVTMATQLLSGDVTRSELYSFLPQMREDERTLLIQMPLVQVSICFINK